MNVYLVINGDILSSYYYLFIIICHRCVQMLTCILLLLLFVFYIFLILFYLFYLFYFLYVCVSIMVCKCWHAFHFFLFIDRYDHIVCFFESSMSNYQVLLTFVHEYIICYVFLLVNAPLPLIDGGGVHEQTSISYDIFMYNVNNT